MIFATLVLQGLTLGPLIRRLGIIEDGSPDHEELRARLVAATAALERLDELAAEEWTRNDTIDRMRGLYRYRQRRFRAQAGKGEDGDDGGGMEDRSLAYQRTIQEVLAAQREALIQLRNEDTNTSVVVLGSVSVDYQKVIGVLDVLQQADITKVGLATETVQ